MYLSKDQALDIFHKLKPSDADEGKAAKEAASSLFRFLAFDHLCKTQGTGTISFPSDRGDQDYHNRQELIDSYAFLGALQDEGENEIAMDCFGKLDFERGRTAKQKVGNDFLTAQVKQAQDTVAGRDYPHRPSHLLTLGGGNTWAITKHTDWQRNLVDFIGPQNSRHWSYAAQFIFRNRGSEFESIKESLRTHFTEELAEHWINNLDEGCLITGTSTSPVADAKIVETLRPAIAMPAPKVEIIPHDAGEADYVDLLDQFKECLSKAQVVINDTLPVRLVSSLSSKRFLILTGLSGSGKTKLAQAFSQWITPITEARDPFTPGAEIASDRVTYWVKNADALAVEFWNKDQEVDAIKVTLPREMIEEWAEYIYENNLERNTPVRELRETIKTPSKFSDQLHSFETHLKAAAFALVEARATQQAAQCYEVVSVGADWTGNENILGYPNGLDSTSYITKPALELIIHAQKNEDLPHFLILDEMNLSHVERYFADILSAIESGEKITLHGDKDREVASSIPRKIKLPKNLFIIGTVNVDETTYMFSPKVLDRANVIEFSMDDKDLDKFLDNPAKPDLDKLAGRGAGYGAAFVNESKRAVNVPEGIKIRYKDEMKAFFTALQSEGAEYGFRVAHEAARFMHFYQVLGGHDATKDDWFDDAFDVVIVQKFLPKLHGSSNKLSPLLKSLWDLCLTQPSVEAEAPAEEGAAETPEKKEESKPVEITIEAAETARYKKSANKIARMKKLLDSHGFASFAEA